MELIKTKISYFFSLQRTYDPERDYARMKSAGVFKSLGKHFDISQIIIFKDQISEGRERPEWLNDYEKELDDAIAALRSSTNKRW